LSSQYRPAEAGGRFREQRFRRGRNLARRDALALGSVLLATIQECHRRCMAGARARARQRELRLDHLRRSVWAGPRTGPSRSGRVCSGRGVVSGC